MEFDRIILASASPRRRELLRQIGIEPGIIVSHASEDIDLTEPSAVVEELARRKAFDVAMGTEPGAVVIGSDTVVALDSRILGKPKSHEEAYHMIKALSGKRHQVYTGVCIARKEDSGAVICVSSFFDRTEVEVAVMSEEEIREYASLKEPMDKAGAYAVQGFFARYIVSLTGSYANVMGLPVSRLYQVLKRISCVNREGEQCQRTAWIEVCNDKIGGIGY